MIFAKINLLSKFINKNSHTKKGESLVAAAAAVIVAVVSKIIFHLVADWLAGIFSKKSAANTLSISAKQLLTSRSAVSKLCGGQIAPNVEKKPYKSCRFVID